MYDATFKVIIFGDPKVGKKTLTQRFLMNLFVSDQTMTIGVDFEVKSLTVDEQRVKLQIWDFGGEERFRFLLPTYVRGARGGFFIYDVTNYSSIAHLDDWLSVINKEIRAEDKFPIITIGNKADLVKERVISSAEGIKIAKSSGVNGFIETSFKTGENVEKAFEALTRLMLNYEGLRKRQKPTIIEILLKRKKGKKQDSKAEVLLKILLKAFPEIKYAVLASNEGFSIAHALPPAVYDIKIATITAALLFLSERVITESKKGIIDHLCIKGSDASLLVMQISSGLVLTACTTDSDIVLIEELKIKIMSIVDDFLKIILRANPEVKSATIGSTERFISTLKHSKSVIEERIATMTIALLFLSNVLINEMIIGNFEEIYVKGSEGILRISKNSTPTIKNITPEYPKRTVRNKLRDLLRKTNFSLIC